MLRKWPGGCPCSAARGRAPCALEACALARCWPSAQCAPAHSPPANPWPSSANVAVHLMSSLLRPGRPAAAAAALPPPHAAAVSCLGAGAASRHLTIHSLSTSGPSGPAAENPHPNSRLQGLQAPSPAACFSQTRVESNATAGSCCSAHLQARLRAPPILRPARTAAGPRSCSCTRAVLPAWHSTAVCALLSALRACTRADGVA